MSLLIVLLLSLSGIEATGQPLPSDPVVKSTITISEPNSRTVWEAPSTVSLEWTTKNIPKDKNLKFYLILDEMVVQELGTFQNLQEAGGIKLGRWLKSAENYQVMAIELYPVNPNYTAKYATPFFTIVKKPRPPVSKPEEQVVENTPASKEIIKPQAVLPTPEKKAPPKIETPPAPVKVVKPRPKRARIAREVSYVKELVVRKKILDLTVWDHGEIDGDVISIYLNGVEILSKFELSEVRHKIKLELDPERANELMVYAHNLGKLYPNTAALWLSDGDRNNMVVLKSDLVKSEALRIRVQR